MVWFRFNSIGRSALFAGALMVVTAAVPLSGFAHFEPGGFQAVRWFWINQPGNTRQALRVLYDRDCINDPGVVDAAASSWTRTATPLYILAVPAPDCWTNHFSSTRTVGNGYQSGTITIRNGNAAGSALAWTTRLHCYWKAFADSCWGWSITGYNGGAVWINDGLDAALIYENHFNGNYDRLSAGGQRDTIAHEMGHALGLEHAGFYAGESSGWYSIMEYCCPSDRGLSFPSQHDVNDINAQYPGW
jgi:hypothetical protein